MLHLQHAAPILLKTAPTCPTLSSSCTFTLQVPLLHSLYVYGAPLARLASRSAPHADLARFLEAIVHAGLMVLARASALQLSPSPGAPAPADVPALAVLARLLWAAGRPPQAPPLQHQSICPRLLVQLIPHLLTWQARGRAAALRAAPPSILTRTAPGGSTSYIQRTLEEQLHEALQFCAELLAHSGQRALGGLDEAQPRDDAPVQVRSETLTIRESW